MATAPRASPRAGGYHLTSSSGEPVWAFVPTPLPPRPEVVLGPALQDLLTRAVHALGGLQAVGAFLPDPDLFLYMYVRKEAVLSSQIEGTSASLSDLLLSEHDAAPGAPLDDVRQTSSYVRALTHGVRNIRDPTGLPLSNRLLREVHAILLDEGRGATRAPGEFRRSQNWIGGTRPGDAAFVPPPHERLEGLMADLETYLHSGGNPLIRAALAHVQLETIHPFLDGNGRVGRILITLVLCESGLLTEPLLYLSLHLKRHRARYYELLGRVRSHGEWEEWLAFFLDGVISTARSAVTTTRAVTELLAVDRARVIADRASVATLRVFDALARGGVVARAPAAAARLGLAPRTAYAALENLESLGVVREVTGRRRDRVWVYDRYLHLLGEGTEETPGG
jgi:Fic family protein